MICPWSSRRSSEARTGRSIAAIRKETRWLYVESPTNPLVKIVDLEFVAEIARRRGIAAVIDGTFASPVLQRPLELGFDLVLHSATKYLNGHSDLIPSSFMMTTSPGSISRMKSA